MSLLTITAADPTGSAPGAAFSIRITDRDGSDVTAHLDGVDYFAPLTPVEADADGVLSIDLAPNVATDPADRLDPEFTYYTVTRVETGQSFLIEKTTSTQNLRDALADDPQPLDPTVLSQKVAEALPPLVTEAVDATFPPLIGYTDQLATIDDAFWTDGSDVVGTAMDELSVVNGWVTVHTPDDGPINTTDAAAHGCRFHDFGADFLDNFESEYLWSATRPAEGTPLIKVNLTTNEAGIGMWPAWDLFDGGSPQSIWALGYIGKNNTHFTIVDYALLTADELAEFSDVTAPSKPVRIKLRCVSNVVTVYINGRLIDGLTLTVPTSLRSSTKHGFAIDNNQTDGATPLGSGGTRPPDFPAARGPWTIAKVITAADTPEAFVTRPELAGALVDRVSASKGGKVSGPIRIVAAKPTFVPGTPGDFTPFYAEYQNTAGATVGFIRAGDDGSGNLEFEYVSGNNRVGLGEFLDRPGIAFTDGSVTTAIAQAGDGSLSIGAKKMQSSAAPTVGDDLTNKTYVDGLVAAQLTTAFDFKASVRAATTANITLSGAQTIDGVSVVAGNRVLVKDQSTGSQNGIYVAAAGAWSRATDADASAEVTSGLSVVVEEGTANGGKLYTLTTANPITVGSTALTFTAQGAGALVASNNLSDLPNASTARTNLGVAIGSNVQAYDADLAAIAALASAADKMPYATGAGAWSLADLTSFARTLLDDASASAARTTLGVAPAQAPVIDNGAVVAATTTETSLLAGTVQIGANVPAVGDDFDFEAIGLFVNLSGSTTTYRPRFKVGGSTVCDQTYSVGALAGLQWRVRATISFEAVGASSTIWVSTTFEMSNGTAVGTTFTTVTSSPLTPATTSAVALALTSTHGATTSIQNECFRATLRARSRI